MLTFIQEPQRILFSNHKAADSSLGQTNNFYCWVDWPNFTHTQSFKWNATCAGGSCSLAKVNSLMCKSTANFMLHITDQQLEKPEAILWDSDISAWILSPASNNFFWSATGEKLALGKGSSKMSLKLLMNIDSPSKL